MILRYPLVLASGSPRRHQLLSSLGLSFQTVLRPVDENYPSDLDPWEIAPYLAEHKAQAYTDLSNTHLVLTADTVVILEGRILGKPESEAQAEEMLHELSGRTHQVVTGLCLSGPAGSQVAYDRAEVSFARLEPAEISRYVQSGEPMDKAGAYGAQDWMGLVAITRLEGSFYTVMGLPTHWYMHYLSSMCDQKSARRFVIHAALRHFS